MIEFTIEDDEFYGIAPRELPKFQKMMDIINDIERRKIYDYHDYIYALQRERIPNVLEKSEDELRRDREWMDPKDFRKKYEDIIVEYNPEDDYLELEFGSLAERDQEYNPFYFAKKYNVPEVTGDYTSLIKGKAEKELRENHRDASRMLEKVFDGKTISREMLSEQPHRLLSRIRSGKHNTGIYWSYKSPRAHGDFRSWKDNGTPRIVLTARFRPRSINNVKSLASNMSRPDEKEIRVKDGTKGRMKKVCICIGSDDNEECQCEDATWTFRA